MFSIYLKEVFTQEWFNRVMQILQLNAVNISLASHSSSSTSEKTESNCGTGLYIASSFFNHSCDPNAGLFLHVCNL